MGRTRAAPAVAEHHGEGVLGIHVARPGGVAEQFHRSVVVRGPGTALRMWGVCVVCACGGEREREGGGAEM